MRENDVTLGIPKTSYIHHNLVFAIGRGSGQLWQAPLPFPYGSMFGIACLNDQINAVLLSAIRRDSGQPVQILKKTHYKLRPAIRGVSDLPVPIS